MSFVHGRGAYFSLDDLDGSPTDISAYLRSASGLEGRSDRPPTTTLGSKGANIINLQQVHRDGSFHTFHVDVEVHDLAHLHAIMAALRSVDAVSSVERV